VSKRDDRAVKACVPVCILVALCEDMRVQALECINIMFAYFGSHIVMTCSIL
jgi:hypothetical protein